MELEKDYLTKINGIGDSYADDILKVYDTYEEVSADSVEEIKDKTGLPENTSRKLKSRIGRLERVHRLEEEPEKVVQELEERLENKIPDLSYHDTEEGDVDMRTHLENLLEQLEDDPDGWIADEIADIERRL